jgi:hypothetical protein
MNSCSEVDPRYFIKTSQNEPVTDSTALAIVKWHLHDIFSEA